MIARAAKQAARDTAPAPCWLLDLPPEVLRHVLEYLCPQSLQFAGAACAKLRRETAAPDLVRAAARRSGEFWVPLVCDESARSKIDHLLPNGLAGSSLAGLRRYFSGTLPAGQEVAARGELFLYVTLEGDGEVVATFGPVDADEVNTNIGRCATAWAAVYIPLLWKNADVEDQYWGTEPYKMLKKTLTGAVYAITRSGTCLVSRMKADWGHPHLNTRLLQRVKDDKNKPVRLDVRDQFEGAEVLIQHSKRFLTVDPPCDVMECGQQARAIHLEIKEHFGPTVREFIELE